MAKNKCTSEESKHSSVEIEHSDNIQNKETPTFCTPQHSLHDVTNNSSNFPDRNLHQTNNTSAAQHHTGLFDNEQSWENIRKFHQSMEMKIFQCNVCKEAWPLNKYSHEGTTDYVCCRCKRDRGIPKKFSFANSMIPSPVPQELQNLTQFEEILIARAFPVIHVYTKPKGGQRAYKGHVITYHKMYSNWQMFCHTAQ